MLAVVKTPRTEITIKGYISVPMLKVLKKEYGTSLRVKPEKDEDALIDVFSTNEYKAFKKSVKPSDYIKTYRENLGLTQEKLGEKIGKSRSFVCDLEKDRRTISKELAKTLAKLFGCSVSVFI